MTVVLLLLTIAGLATAAAWVGCAGAERLRTGGIVTSVTGSAWHHASCAGAMTLTIGIGVVALVTLAGWLGVQITPWLIALVLVPCGAFGAIQVVRYAQAGRRPRFGFEALTIWIFQAFAGVAVLITVGIIYTVLAEAVRFFSVIPLSDFLFGLEWSPQIAIRADQAGSSGAFGVIPLFMGTMLISAVAMLVAVPFGLLSAIYLSEFASIQTRNRIKPALEFLAGVPTVVYGFFAVVTLGPLLRDLGGTINITISNESALAAGLVIGVMTIPFVASLSEDSLFAIPQELRDGSMALGATHAETATKVAVPAALPGIAAGCLLALSRAIGETMIVVMAAGLAANLTVNPLEAVTTVTTQIVTLLIGDQEFDDPKTLAAFALGLLLFVFTLVLNLVALQIVRKYQEQYE